MLPGDLTQSIPALVLAGGKTTPEFAAEAGVAHRALADIHGRPMVSYVLRALREAESISRVFLVAPEGFPDQPDADERVTSDGGLVENIAAGLARCADAEHALLITADVPFITAAAVDDYARRCLREAADCCYAAVPREACQERFPGMKRTYLHTPGLTVTGGNLVVQRLSAFEKQAKMVREAYLRRKSPLFLAKLIGPGNLLKFALRRLTIPDIEVSASRLLGTRCRLIVTPHAELGTDVDRPEDLRLARQLLRPT